MPSSFLAGVVAGYGIAIPVGAIAVLIIETGLRRGFRPAAAAGAGAATADGVYATIAALFGVALAGLIGPWEQALRIASVAVLLVIAGRTLRRGLRDLAASRAGAARRTSSATPSMAGEPTVEPEAPTAPSMAAGAGVVRTFLTFLGLTLMNPMTVVYFAALMLGLPSIGSGVGERAAFVAGAFIASLSWQWLLAIVGAVLHRRLPPAFRSAITIAGALVVAGFAVGIATGI